MPLTRVRDLVRHASQHGYLVASFEVHGADEVQAVVNAAEAARAPAIIAVDEQGTALLRHDITLAVAASVAAAASVPIGIEVVSRAQDGCVIGARTDSAMLKPFPVAANHTAVDDLLLGIDPPDREMWFALPAPATELDQAAAAGYRLGLRVAGSGQAEPSPAACRKQMQTLRARHQAVLVADGDLPWSNGGYRALSALGVAKINFDQRLAQIMAKANRRAAQKAADQYRVAVTETFTALTDEVFECLRRAGGSGRAADVMACAAGDDQEPARAASLPRSLGEYAGRRVAEASRRTTSLRARWQDAQTSHAG